MFAKLRRRFALVVVSALVLSSVAAAPSASPSSFDSAALRFIPASPTAGARSARRGHGLLRESSAAVTMQVEPHFGGHFKFGEWLPLRVTLNNDGPPLRTEVRADTTQAGGQTTYIAPIELPSGAYKRITLYVQPPSFAQAIRVRLVDDSGELASESVPVSVERNVNYVVGVIAPRAEPFAVLAGLTLNPAATDQAVPPKGVGQPLARPVKTLPIPLSDIPERPEGLRSLDALVISGVDTSDLSLAQRHTLQIWVEQGGRLILGGGASAARSLAGLPDEWAKDFRATSSTSDVSSLNALSAFAGQDVRVPGPFVVTWPASSPVLRTLIEQDGYALLVERRVGEGYVNYVALDLAGSPFDAWAGTLRFWEKLLTPGSAYPLNAPPDVSPRAMRANTLSYALQSLPTLELPSINWLSGLLAVYIVLVGPVNYLVLRRAGKLAWGWLSIPALTLLFSIGAFLFGFSVRGGDVIINKISFITFSARAAAPMQTFVGIFSPERTAYTLNVPGRALIAPLVLEGSPWGKGNALAYAGAEIVQGEPAQARGVQVSQWAMQGFQTESPVPDGWRIESSLSLEGDRVRGTLVNHTSELIADAVIVNGTRFARLSDLSPGQSQMLDQALQQSSGPFPYFLFMDSFRNVGPTGPSREVQVRQQLLSGYYQSTGGPPQPPIRPTLIGWMRASPLDVQVMGVRWATQQMSLVIATLHTQYAPGAIHLYPGSLPARLVARQGDVGVCGSNNQMYMNNGSATLEYQLPEELTGMSITRLALTVQMPGGGDAPTIEVFNRSGEWIKLEKPQSGRNELSDPARFFSADGTLRVRASSGAAGSKGCVLFDLDVEGELKK